jgi:hypothetical protein
MVKKVLAGTGFTLNVINGAKSCPPRAAYDTQPPWFLNVPPVSVCRDCQPSFWHALAFSLFPAAPAGLPTPSTGTAIVAATAKTAARDFQDLNKDSPSSPEPNGPK